MYRDNTLIPSEAVRLAALGMLAEGDMHYQDLAQEIRYFTTRMAGPSLDLLGSSLELLRYEGLAEPVAGGTGMEDNACLRITEAGREAFERLMASNVRPPANEISKLIVAIKVRFLHLLPEADRIEQAEVLSEMAENELARLQDLRQDACVAVFDDWLDFEIGQAQARLDWFQRLLPEA